MKLPAAIALSIGVSFANPLPRDVASSADLTKPLKAGVRAPSATLRDLDGKSVTLDALFRRKPTVLIFYRGGWCPFCNAHLSDLQRVQGDLTTLGYQLIAVSPDKPSELKVMLDRDHLTYGLYSDSKASAIRKYGIAFRVDDQTFATYRDSYKINLEKSSGETHHILPVPSVFIVNRQGKIVYAHSNPDYKVRLKGDEVVAAAREALR